MFFSFFLFLERKYPLSRNLSVSSLQSVSFYWVMLVVKFRISMLLSLCFLVLKYAGNITGTYIAADSSSLAPYKLIKFHMIYNIRNKKYNQNLNLLLMN